MHIVIFAFGSRGDVQPYLALAVGLQQAGHRVTLVASHNFVPWIGSYGVDVHPVRFSVQELMQKPEVQAALKSRNMLRQVRLIQKEITAGMVEALNEFWQAAQTADFVVQTGTGHGGVEAANQRGIPMAFAYVLPAFAPTRAFPSFFLPVRRSLGGGYNYLTHLLMHRVMWFMLGGPTNKWRASCLGLPPWGSFAEMRNARRPFDTPWLFAYSPSVLPKPPEWEAHHHVTGYWFLDPPMDWQPPPNLMRFLESGPPPVYIGFGSMSYEDPERLTRIALRALERSGQRGVLSTGWGGVTRQTVSSDVLYVDDVPHSWLFPRMAAVVHHGGAGTTAAGLRAGVPNIITPVMGDQHAWARLVTDLGVGPRAATVKKLTAEKLAEAIHTAVNDSAMRARAATLGEKIRAEDGVACVVEVIERHAAEFEQRARAKPLKDAMQTYP